MDFTINLLRGLLGIAVMLGVCYLFSENRSRINWKTIGVGVLMQILLAVFILKVPGVDKAFDTLAKYFVKILSFSEEGAMFLFSGLGTNKGSFGHLFAFQVLPVIVFFSAITSILYYFGILQKIVYGLAWVMAKLMGLSGPESLAMAANIFIGQTEAPLMVKPYLKNMSRSEIMCLMTGGMATIAGSVLTAFISFLGGDDPVAQQFYAKHLLSASLISAPAAIVAAKLLVPELQKKDNKKVEVYSDKASNVLDVISTGTTDGLKLAVNVAAMLLVFTSVVALLNYLMYQGVGSWTGLNEWVEASTDGKFKHFDFTYLLGLLFAPVAWILGTPSDDIMVVGQLLGQKTVINEFIAYQELGKVMKSDVALNPKSIIIATYALCGFANFASIGIQIGGISSLAPNQRKTLTELGMLALLGGTVAGFLTACIAGILA